MLKAATLFFICALCVIAGCDTPELDTITLDPDSLPYRFSETEYYPERNSATHFIDLDGDGIEARVVISWGENPGQSSVTSTRYNGTTISQVGLPAARSIRCQFALDINNDGFKELFLLSREHDTLYLSIINVYAAGDAPLMLRRYPISLSADTLTRFYAGGSFRLRGLLRGNNRQAPLIVASYSSDRSDQPSSVGGYDALSGALVWLYPMGPHPEFSMDLPDDYHDQARLFLGTTSTGTAGRANGTDNAHTYMLGLHDNGTPLWRPAILGEAFASARVFLDDLNDDGTDELFCLFSSSNRHKEVSYLKVFNPDKGTQIGLAKTFSQRIILPDESPVLIQSRRKLFVIGTFAGMISLIDQDFRTVRERQLPAEIVALQIRNILGDEEKEIIVSMRTDKTVILDSRLEPLAVIASGARVSISRCNVRAEQTLVLENGRNVMVGSLLPNSGIARNILTSSAILVVCILVGYISYRSFLFIKIFRTASANSRDISILLFNGRGRLLSKNETFCSNYCIASDKAIGKRWEELFDKEYHRPTRDFVETALAGQEFQRGQIELYSPSFSGTTYARAHPVFLGSIRIGTFISIHDITHLARRDQMVNWASVAHKMAHEMKTPLSTIWFTLARIRQEIAAGAPAHVDAHLESIEEEVRRVDNYVKGFMKLANINPPNAALVHINNVVEEILHSYTEKLPESCVIELDLAPELPLVKVDVNLFTVAMRNLLDNSVAAMKGRGILKVSTYLVRNLNDLRVYFALSDTGCGIAEQDLPKVFQPYFSRTDGGTGLGLAITKKIIEDHEGSITFTTRAGFGTEFIIQLPVPGSQRGAADAS